MPARARLSMIAAAALTAALIPIVGALPAHAAATLTVDDDLACPGSDYTTISAAVADAQPGDTIQVCPGIYPETVHVDKSLTFLGAMAGKDGRKGRGDPAKESIVDNLQGDFIVEPGVNAVTIDGFTIQGAGSDELNADGIEAFSGGSGFTIKNNVIQHNQEGMQLENSDPTVPTLITRNSFIDNSVGTSSEGGTGIAVISGPANSTTIVQNAFSGDRQTAINFNGDPDRPSRGLLVSQNTSTDDATFVVASNSINATIVSNTITNTDDENGSGILDFGGNLALRISHNTITGGGKEGTAGIRIADFSGTASTATTLIHNVISGRYYGVRISGDYQTLFVRGSQIKRSRAIGIWVNGASSGDVFLHNTVQASATHDCEDDSEGAGTAGTANIWRGNTGKTGNSLPAGICQSS